VGEIACNLATPLLMPDTGSMPGKIAANKFELVINIKTAKTPGLVMPALLARASDVIEQESDLPDGQFRDFAV
jgi:hypothetical protein